jgi:hypothetical protein
MEMENALRTIIAASPAAAGEALACIRAIRANSPVVGVRFARVVETALTDPDASFTPEQRAEIAELLDIPAVENRAVTFRLRLTEAERIMIQDRASSAGLTMSEWARRRLFPDSEEQQ